MKKLLFELCALSGASGSENDASAFCADYLKRFTDDVKNDFNNNVIAVLGDRNAEKTVLLDAHIDQIGFMVTEITDGGFLKVAKVGGVDLRTAPDAVVTVRGREDLRGVICCIPPHLSDGKEDKAVEAEKVSIDLGLPAEKVRELVRIGDSVSFYAEPKELMNNRVSAVALDDRAGVAALLKVAEMLSVSEPNVRVIILLSCQEENGATGAKTVPFDYEIDECISVDVSFAAQPELSGQYARIELGKGPMLGVSPVLDKDMYNSMKEICVAEKIPYQIEVMGGRTGTNADSIAITKSGVRSALVSIPQRNMHTQAEIVSVEDVENTARLICSYILGGAV